MTASTSGLDVLSVEVWVFGQLAYLINIFCKDQTNHWMDLYEHNLGCVHLSWHLQNEFMSCWDGLRTSETARVLVLAATNRPMDLDEVSSSLSSSVLSIDPL